jgi:perosamine synthetase
MKKIGGKFGKYNGNEFKYINFFLQTENNKYKKIDWTTKLEKKFSKISGFKYCIAVNSGTSGLHAALYSCGVKPGDEVISPALTVIMDTFAILMCGAKPVYTDVNPNTFNIDLENIKKKITKKTKAIITVSLFGLPCDLKPILDFARKKGIFVIDDSAETIHGYYKNKFSGFYSDLAVYSFENKKHLTTGSEGGIVATNNRELAIKVRKFSGLGYKALRPLAGRSSLNPKIFQNPDYSRHDSFGYNYRLNKISSAIGLAQLERAKKIVQKRIKVAKIFLDAIKNCKWLIPQKVSKNYKNSYFTLALKYEGMKCFHISWNNFYRQFKLNGGHGFYAAWKCPFNEPVIKNLKTIKLNKKDYPSALELQKKLILLKTNYRNLVEAQNQAKILKKTIAKIELVFCSKRKFNYKD